MGAPQDCKCSAEINSACAARFRGQSVYSMAKLRYSARAAVMMAME